MEVIEIKKMVSLIKKIDKENPENIIAIYTNGDIIIGNLNFFFVYSGNINTVIADENVVMPMIDFPNVSGIKKIVVENDVVSIYSNENTVVTCNVPKVLNDITITSFDDLTEYAYNKSIPRYQEYGKREFLDKFTFVTKVNKSSRNQFIQLAAISTDNPIFFDQDDVFATDSYIVNVFRINNETLFSMDSDIVAAMKIFSTPLNVYISNFPDNRNQKVYADDATDEEKKKALEEAYMPQVMIQNHKLSFIYTHTTKNVPSIPNFRAVYPIEKHMMSFSVMVDTLKEISDTSNQNICEFVHFKIKGQKMFVWASNESEVVLKKTLFVYSQVNARAIFSIKSTVLKTLLTQIKESHVRFKFYGMDRPLIADDNILAVTAKPDYLIEEEMVEIFGAELYDEQE